MLDVDLIKFKLPHRCARCGSPDVAHQWVTQSAVGRSTYKFTLPLCIDCYTTLIKRRQLGAKLMIAAGLVVIGVFILAILGAPSSDPKNPPLIILVPLALILLGLFIGIRFLTYDRLINFNGRTFDFRNEDFFRDFAELNPALVRTSHLMRRRM